MRVPGQDAVYRAELRPDKLSTKFGDWIEKDLLKMNTWDIKEVVLNNYSLRRSERPDYSPATVLVLAYDGNASKWTLNGLEDGEELNTEKLNKLQDRSGRPENRRRAPQTRGLEPRAAGRRRGGH